MQGFRPEVYHRESPLFSDDVAKLVTPEFLSILDDVYQLSLFRTARPLHKNISGCNLDSLFRQQRLGVEHHLLNYIASTPKNTNTPLEQCLQFSLLLFINTAIWVNFDTSCAIVRVPAENLKQKLEAFDVTSMTHSDSISRVLLWVHFLGVHTATDRGQRKRYINTLRQFCQTCHNTTVDQFRELLFDVIDAGQAFDKTIPLVFTECTQEGQRT